MPHLFENPTVNVIAILLARAVQVQIPHDRSAKGRNS